MVKPFTNMIKNHWDLEVFKSAIQLSKEIFVLTSTFPKEEMYSLSDQVRRSSRSVCANLAEAFAKKNYPASFAYKISDCISEAAETQVWLKIAFQCGYIPIETESNLRNAYDKLIRQLVIMENHPEKWTFPPHRRNST